MVCVDDCRSTMAVVIDVATREIPGATSVTAIQIHLVNLHSGWLSRSGKKDVFRSTQSRQKGQRQKSDES